MNERTEPYEVTLGHKLSVGAGIGVVAVLDALGLNLSGPGVEGAISAGLFYGVGGVVGGLVTYEVVQRLRNGLGWLMALLAGVLVAPLWFMLVAIAALGILGEG
jgi:hypothetical protein